ncbi:MAG: lysozyme inhibitor LprI family protein [Spongiibacteraceae bacterium]
MKFLYRVAAVSLFLLSVMAAANATPVDTLISTCRKDSPTAFSQCIRKHAERAHTEVKDTEKAVRASIAASAQDRKSLPFQKSAFEASVEAFRKYRQHECTFAASLAANASATEDLQYACYAELDANRSEQLRAWISRAGQ